MWPATTLFLMQKSEKSDAPLRISGEIGRGELGALVCDVLLLGVFLYNQLFYGLDMWFLILPLLAIGLYLALFGVIPEKYLFTETSLEIWHLFYKAAVIPYEAVFNLETSERDSFVNLLQDNKVKIYHTAGRAKRLTICRPQNVVAFAEELKKRCPEFEEDGQESKLDIFFKG